jgi:hypothetical protein
MQTQESFPRWVDVLFTRLRVRYGSAWEAKWEGIPAADVKADWREELSTIFERNPKAITYALNHLPDNFPPNVDGFMKLCLMAPSPTLALAAPVDKPDKAFAAQTHAKVQAAAAKQVGSPAEIFVAKMRAKVANGERLSSQQRYVLAACEKMLGIAEAA